MGKNSITLITIFYTSTEECKKDFAKNSTPVFTLNRRKKLQRFRENRQKLFASVSKGTLDSQDTY